MSPGLRPASGQGTPSIRRTGRRFTYWSNWRRMGISRPHSETWSGTPGKPTAPRKMASCPRICSRPSSGIMRPVLWYTSQLQSKCSHSKLTPMWLPTASSTRMPSGTTSLPMPSPGMTAMRCLVMRPLGSAAAVALVRGVRCGSNGPARGRAGAPVMAHLPAGQKAQAPAARPPAARGWQFVRRGISLKVEGRRPPAAPARAAGQGRRVATAPRPDGAACRTPS